MNRSIYDCEVATCFAVKYQMHLCNKISINELNHELSVFANELVCWHKLNDGVWNRCSTSRPKKPTSVVPYCKLSRLPVSCNSTHLVWCWGLCIEKNCFMSSISYVYIACWYCMDSPCIFCIAEGNWMVDRCLTTAEIWFHGLVDKLILAFALL